MKEKERLTKTVINIKPPRKHASSSEEKRMKQFVKENEKKLKEINMLKKCDDSKKFLQDHPHLVRENTANYLVVWCINLEMD